MPEPLQQDPANWLTPSTLVIGIPTSPTTKEDNRDVEDERAEAQIEDEVPLLEPVPVSFLIGPGHMPRGRPVEGLTRSRRLLRCLHPMLTNEAYD